MCSSRRKSGVILCHWQKLGITLRTQEPPANAGGYMEKRLLRQEPGHDRALLALDDLPEPRSVGTFFAEAQIAAGYPAEIPRLGLIDMAFLEGLGIAMPYLPAGCDGRLCLPPPDIKHDPRELLNVRWHRPPALLIALDGARGDSQQAGHLGLTPAKRFADCLEVLQLAGHKSLSAFAPLERL